jgi:hypothetical protein
MFMTINENAIIVEIAFVCASEWLVRRLCGAKATHP